MSELLEHLSSEDPRLGTDYCLSDDDLRRLFKGKVNIISYPEVCCYSSIAQLLDPFGCCIILYEANDNYGHWCCVIKRDSPEYGEVVEFFDPYGEYPDDQLDHISPLYRINNDEDHPYLLELLCHSDDPAVWNPVKFQSMTRGVNTCGRWCALRIALRMLTINEFKKFVDTAGAGMTRDELVSLLTDIDL